MSLREALEARRRRLNHRGTRVTDSGGRVTLEERVEGGRFEAREVGRAEGFVVDTSPDLQVATVLSDLFMGSQDVAVSDDLLKKHRITHVLSVGVEVERVSEGVRYFFVQALALPEFSIRSLFEHCFAIIDSAREEGGRVLVHCNAGISRSAAVVIAYLMHDKNVTFQQAYDYLKKLRPSIRPNEGFIMQLKVFDQVMSMST